MKKLISGLMITATFAFAEGYTQGDRILDMQKMAEAMQDIQSGFFYNNVDIVKAGTKQLKETIIKIRPIDDEVNNKDIYEKWLQNYSWFPMITLRRTKKKAEDIEARFADGDATQALQAYNNIAGKCLKCHINLRKW